ncbi:MAG: S1 RNA-binding domain-containing protein, partial [Planctomycetota bacterium]
MRTLTEHDIPAWVENDLLSPARTRPIVAITTHQGSDRGWIEPVALERALGDLAEVVVIPTGDPTWALSEALPPRLEVYGGAIRIWWAGLTREANPLDHRLYFVHGLADADRVQQAIVDAIVARDRARSVPTTAEPAPAAPPAEPLPPEPVRVTALSTDEIVVAAAHRRGPLVEADLPLDFLIGLLNVDCQFPARPLRPLGDGRWSFSIAGLLPDAWPRFAAEAKVGHVFTCRVQNLNQAKKLVFVDVLPGVTGICHVRELDHTFVDQLADFVQPGDLLAFALLEIDAAQRRLQLSRKRAFTAEPRPLPPLFAGGRPFAWQAGLPWFKHAVAGQGVRTTFGAAPTASRPPSDAVAAEAAEKTTALEQELAGAREERLALVAQIRQLREQLQDSKREQRALEQRQDAEAQRSGGDDPLAAERAFLQAVRVRYARLFDEDDRAQRPLQRLRVGREFLATVRDTPGIDVDKLLDVCVEVAADIAHKKAGRDVHPLRAG